MFISRFVDHFEETDVLSRSQWQTIGLGRKITRQHQTETAFNDGNSSTDITAKFSSRSVFVLYCDRYQPNLRQFFYFISELIIITVQPAECRAVAGGRSYHCPLRSWTSRFSSDQVCYPASFLSLTGLRPSYLSVDKKSYPEYIDIVY